MSEPDTRRCAVLIGVQQALLGEVTENLRAVLVAYGPTTIQVTAYFYSEITDEDREAMSLVETELIAAFPSDHEITIDRVHAGLGQAIPRDRIWVFYRREVSTP